MKKIIFVVLLGCSFLLSNNTLTYGCENCGCMAAAKQDLSAQEASSAVATDAVAAVALPSSQPVEVGNKICPVMNNSISPGSEVKVEYNGKIYNLCCLGCVAEFNSSPDKYVQAIEGTMASEGM